VTEKHYLITKGFRIDTINPATRNMVMAEYNNVQVHLQSLQQSPNPNPTQEEIIILEQFEESFLMLHSCLIPEAE
jgi:hypothetical protein